MKNAFLTMILGLGFAHTVLAAEPTQFWFQPGAGNSTFSAGLETSSNTVKVGAQEFKVTGPLLQMKYSYGLDTNMSVSISTDYGTKETDTAGSKTKEAGLGDLEGQFLANSGDWYYGTDASVALGKQKEATTTSDGTRSTGGYSLTPFVGYHTTLGFGGKVSYQYFTDRTVETSTTDKVTSGGNIITINPYWEMNYGAGKFGIQLTYGMIDSSTTKQSGQADSKLNSFTAIGAGVYVAHKITDSGTLLANLDYVNVPEFDATSSMKSSSTGTTFSAAYRFGF